MVLLSVADPVCLSRIPDPDFTHPGSKNSNKREGWNKTYYHTFFVATNFTKLKILLFLKCWRKTIWASFQRIIEHFTQKFVNRLSKIWVWYPGSEIQDPKKSAKKVGKSSYEMKKDEKRLKRKEKLKRSKRKNKRRVWMTVHWNKKTNKV